MEGNLLMMSFVHYISALRRLKESEKTVYMLGGEREAPPMILAQRDMIKNEVEYYQEESLKLAFIIGAVAFIGTAVYNLLKQLGKI
jgi:hypothetical protein